MTDRYLLAGFESRVEQLFGALSVFVMASRHEALGSSVLDVINAFSKACGKPVAHHFAPRRDGDLPAYWADATKADKELNWRVTRTLDEMAQDTWRWQSRHPQGYPD